MHPRTEREGERGKPLPLAFGSLRKEKNGGNMENIDNKMSRLCGRLMSNAQMARDAQEYILEEMQYVAEQNPDREDVRACIEEIKQKCKSAESENWAIGNHWGEHFDGISPVSDKENDTEEQPKDDEEDTETDGMESKG